MSSVHRVKFRQGEKPHHQAKRDHDYAGEPKGLRQICWKLGYDVTNFKRSVKTSAPRAEKLLTYEYILSEQPHVENAPSMLEAAIVAAWHIICMIPKFHCECTPVKLHKKFTHVVLILHRFLGDGIERVWGRAKWFCRRMRYV